MQLVFAVELGGGRSTVEHRPRPRYLPHVLIDQLLGAPVGVAVLAELEARQRRSQRGGHGSGVVLGRSDDPVPDFEVGSDAAAVARAVAWVRERPLGELLDLAVDAGKWRVGSWVAGAPDELARCYRFAPDRTPIAEAIIDTFGAELSSPCDPAAQQWWFTPPPDDHRDRPLFVDFSDVYGNGEFPWAGLRTVTDPPAKAHEALVSAWEMHPEPVSRWHLPVEPGARVWELNAPADWVRLVEAYPKIATRAHASWELPGPNQHPSDVRALLDVPGQHGARAEIRSHVLPDWSAVSRDWDGVHLSWAGFLTTEGRVCDLDGGAVTMLRSWSSERTVWLADVFGEPEPMSAPALDDAAGTDVRTDHTRQRRDRARIRTQLGR